MKDFGMSFFGVILVFLLFFAMIAGGLRMRRAA